MAQTIKTAAELVLCRRGDGMSDFDEIFRVAVKCNEAPRMRPLEEQVAFYGMVGVIAANRQKLINDSEARELKAKFRNLFHMLQISRIDYVEDHFRYQEYAKKASGKLSELMKAITPAADFRSLLLEALDIIALNECMQCNSLRRNAEERINGIMPLSIKAGGKSNADDK